MLQAPYSLNLPKHLQQVGTEFGQPVYFVNRLDQFLRLDLASGIFEPAILQYPKPV